jgi:hypothetical protein
MIQLIIYVIIIVLTFIFFISIVPRKVKKSPAYTCGEPMKFEKPEGLFYKTLASMLGLKKLQKINTGNLDDYVLMIFICFMLLLMLLVII